MRGREAVRGNAFRATAGGAGRARRRRVAGDAAVLQRQGRDVGQFVRGLQPVGGREGVPRRIATTCRSPRRCRASISRCSTTCSILRDAVADPRHGGASPRGTKIFGDAKLWSAVPALVRNEAAVPRTGSPRRQSVADLQTWIEEHPAQDAYWDRFKPTPDNTPGWSCRSLSVTGRYDGDQPGALAFHRGHMRYGSAATRAKHHLVIGPWDHAGTRLPPSRRRRTPFSGRPHAHDMNTCFTRSWYDWTMEDGAKPPFLKDKGRVLRDGRGSLARYAPTLAVTARVETWHLDSVASRANACSPPSDPAAAFIRPGRGTGDTAMPRSARRRFGVIKRGIRQRPGRPARRLARRRQGALLRRRSRRDATSPASSSSPRGSSWTSPIPTSWFPCTRWIPMAMSFPRR